MYTVKTWEELEIQDDFLFSKVMRDKEICKITLEKLLHIKIKDLKYIEEQKNIDIAFESKSVRLDVYVEDEDRVFNVEMQTTAQKDLAKRSRYYQGMIDLNIIEKGAYYKNLKESYIIFICTFDPFDMDKPQYTFENFCVEEKSLRLGDAAKKLFFNTKAYEKADDPDIRAFLKYVGGQSSDCDFVRMLEKKVKEVKANKEWMVEYMTLLMREQEIREEARAEGRKEGRVEGRKEGRAEGRIEGRAEGRKEGRAKGRIEGIMVSAKNLYENGFSIEEIAKLLKIDISELLFLKK